MKIYIAYKCTGESKEKLEQVMNHLCNCVTKAGHKNYCTLFDANLPIQNNNALFDHAFKEMDSSDLILVFINSEERSIGMLLEIGYAIAKKKKMILLIKKDVSHGYIRDFFDKKLEFSDLDDLTIKLNKKEIFC